MILCEKESTYCEAAVNMFALGRVKPVMRIKSDVHVRAYLLVCVFVCAASTHIWGPFTSQQSPSVGWISDKLLYFVGDYVVGGTEQMKVHLK